MAINLPIVLDILGKRYGRLPSELMNLEMIDLMFCADVCSLALEHELELRKKAEGDNDDTRPDIEAQRKELRKYLDSLPKDSPVLADFQKAKDK